MEDNYNGRQLQNTYSDILQQLLIGFCPNLVVVVVGRHLQLGLRLSRAVTIAVSKIKGRGVRLTVSAWVSFAHPSLYIFLLIL